MSAQGQISQAGKNVLDDQTVHDWQNANSSQMPDQREISDDDKLSYDWNRCEMLQIAKAFTISDYEGKADDHSSSDFMVPEPPSLSGIIESTTQSRSSSTSTTNVEENYIVDDMSSLSKISDIEVSNGPPKHEFGKEKVEREGNMYNKLYNACLKGRLSISKEILENLNTQLLSDEDGQTPLYAACIGNQSEVVNLLVDFGYNVNHQDKEGKTPLHVAFENHTPDLAKILITQYNASTTLRDTQNWTPVHTAIDRGFYSYSQQLSDKFLHQDVGSEVSWIQLHAACFQENIQDVKLLLDANTDVNHVNSAGHTSLHISVTKSNIDLVILLLDQNVNVNCMTIDCKTPLHTAVDKCEDAIVQELLSHEADPTLKDALGNTSLHLAVQLKQGTEPRMWQSRARVHTQYLYSNWASYRACTIQTVQSLTDHGADVNALNNEWQTPLWFACSDRQEHLVKFLLHKGSNSDIADKNGDSSLHAAMYGCCSTEIIQEVIEHGAHVNTVNTDGASPLLLACSTAQTESIKLLLRAKSDPNITFNDGDASLHAAIDAQCSKETIQEIIDYGGDVNAVNKKGRTALLLGCFYREMDSVKILLEAGSDPSIVDEEGFSCLHAAVDGYCSRDTLKSLIDHGAHIDAKRKDGTNALLRACHTGQSESVMFLLESGADVNITKPDGNTSLHLAISGHCSKETMQKIIHYGVAVNAINSNGETALLYACSSAQATSVKLLLETGVDPNISDTRGRTSLHFAAYGCPTNGILHEIINHKTYLNAQDLSGYTALFLACVHRQQGSVKILLEAGANTNIANKDGSTSLHAAVYGNCNKKILRTLIDHGAYVDAKNEKNLTSLLLACSRRNIGAINVLLKAGADVNIVGVVGDTCLHRAISADCNKEVLQAIINHGANVDATNKWNESSLLLACDEGNIDAINVLFSAGADVNIVDAVGETCLHKAISADCSRKVLQTIINHGAKVDATNKLNESSLLLACGKGNIDAINVLFNARADVNIVDAVSNTCLHRAIIKECSMKVLQTIVDHGADVNAINKWNQTALALASMERNVDAINVLLNAGADPNIADVDGNTCLHDATKKDCRKEVLQSIIDHGANVNVTNKQNFTALMMACIKGNVGVVSVLLNARTDPNRVNADGDTCLHVAIRTNCSKDILQSLIKHGANVNATNKQNLTALMIACTKGNVDAISVLLNAKADPNIPDAYGDTCLQNAVGEINNADVLQAIIVLSANVNATNKWNETALEIALMKGNVNAVDILITAGADVNMSDSNSDTYLHNAVRMGCSAQALQAIVDHGADVNATNKWNQTAVALALMERNVDAINVLLNVGADLNIADDDGDTCLHEAIRIDYSKEMILSIIEHGANVNAANKQNLTALKMACMKGNVNAASVLLNSGADVNMADAAGDTCLHEAIIGKFSREVLKEIVDNSANVNATNKWNETALELALMEGNVDAINILLNVLDEPNSADPDGETYLHNAVRMGCSAKAFQAIIDHGADVNAINKWNQTALALASMEKNIDAINILLNAGADPNIADSVGNTCLHEASRTNCSNEVLQSIIDHDVDVNAINKWNQTALALAVMEGNVDAINVLLNAAADPNIADVDGETCLHEAIRNDCRKEVLQSILDHEANVNVTTKQIFTALMMACTKGNAGVIRILLKANADPNIVNADGDTCLHVTTRKGCNKDILQSLLNHGANVNATNKLNVTALMIACTKGNVDAISALLNAKADPNIPDAYGDTCLQNAVEETDNADVLQAIVGLSANVNATNKWNETALEIALIKGNVNAINILITAGAEVNMSDNNSDTYLHNAVRMGCSAQALQAIVDHGADVNSTNKWNQTAVALALMERNVDAINVLLNVGADPNIADDDGDTCLHEVIRIDYSKEMILSIIEHGANVNAANNQNFTALKMACVKRNIDAVSVLLNAGADVNMADAAGDTCLHEAITGNFSREMLKAIVDNSANVNATNKWNETALELALMEGNVDAINILLNVLDEPNSADPDGETYLHNAVRMGCSAKAFQAIIDHGADVNAINKWNQTALALASMEKNIDAINILLNAGADPNIADADGNTCLHEAIRTDCSKELLQSIIDHYADVNVVNNEGVTVLLLACEVGQSETVEVLIRAAGDASTADRNGDTCLHILLHREYNHVTFQMLLDHGVPINTANRNHQTPHMLASNQGNIDAMCALLNAGADPISCDADDNSNIHQTDDTCSNNVSLQTIIQWLNLRWHYVDLPALEITESRCFNVVAHVIYYKFRHSIWSNM